MKPSSSHLIHLPHYTEGPATDAHGNMFCTTLHGGSILLFDKLLNWKPWATMSCPNGQFIDDKNDHLVCDSKQSIINRFTSEGHWVRTEMNGSCANEKVQVPNDIIVSASGGLYFSDSIRASGKVFFIAADGTGHVIAKGLDYPNGLVLSADNRLLFVAESYKNRILKIRLNHDGTALGKPEVFSELPSQKNDSGYHLPDGMAIDKKGNLWVAHYGMQAVQVISEKGQLIDTIAMPFPLVSNVHIITEDPFGIMVTGGFAEPGPGALFILLLGDN